MNFSYMRPERAAILSMIAIVGFVMFFQGNMTGQSYNPYMAQEAYCADYDGDNPNEASFVKTRQVGPTKTISDWCDGSVLVEQLCEGHRPVEKRYGCSAGCLHVANGPAKCV